MIEQVTGEPLAASITRDLTQPAGLERVWVQDTQQPDPPLTVSEEDPNLDTVDDDGPWLPSRSMASSAGPAGGIAADAPTDNVAIAVLVPARHLMKTDVSTYDVPQLLLKTLRQG